MLQIRPPTAADVPAMRALMAPHVEAERLLPRSERAVLERLRDYLIATDGAQLAAVGSVSMLTPALAEIGALAVHPDQPTAGTALLDALLSEARDMGADRVFAMSDGPRVYADGGFLPTTLAALPEKRDRHCLRCALAPRCRQLAFSRSLVPLAATA